METNTRLSWDTSVKLFFRLGLEDAIPADILKLVPATNRHRWRNESENKYVGCQVHQFVDNELKLYHRIGSTDRVKALNKAYFKLEDTLMFILDKIKGKKRLFNEHKDLIVNQIEQVKDTLGINNACHSSGRVDKKHYYDDRELFEKVKSFQLW